MSRGNDVPLTVTLFTCQSIYNAKLKSNVVSAAARNAANRVTFLLQQ